jgi:ribosomal-protein-alanine N-acetyltransferase
MTTQMTKPVQKQIAVHIRWMIRRDMPEVLAIDTATFQFPWSEDDFVRCLRQRNAIGLVAEHGEKIAGFAIYEIHKNRIHIMNFAVHQAYQRRGVGKAMVDKLVGKLSKERRNRIMLEVRETNLDAQLFFKAMGFRAVSLLRDFYWDTPEAATEDAYLFQYRYTSAEDAQ